MEQEDRLPVVQGKEKMMMDVAEGKETKKGKRTVVIARRKRKGQPRVSGVAVNRIDDMFRGSENSPMVVDHLGRKVKNNRKHLGDEESSVVAIRKRQKGF